MKRMDSASARVFLSIIEEGGIGRAALRENIVASAVSKRLSDLEEIFGMTLVERRPHGIVPTPAGETLARHARLVLQALDRAHEELSEHEQGVRGCIRLRASSSSLAAGLPADIREFTQKHSSVRMDLEEMGTPQIFREVLENRADLGIGPDIFRPTDLQSMPYAPYDLCVVVPRAHPLAKRRSMEYAEALEYEQVEQRHGSVLTQLLDQTAKQNGWLKRTRIRVNGFETVCSMIGAEMGVGVVPSFMKAAQSRAHGLRFIPLTDSWAHTRIVIVFRADEAIPHLVKKFIDHLTQYR